VRRIVLLNVPRSKKADAVHHPPATNALKTAHDEGDTMDYERSITLPVPHDQAVTRTRDALSEQGFGILSEIDVQATLREKRGLEMENYLILGACNPDSPTRPSTSTAASACYCPATSSSAATRAVRRCRSWTRN